MASYSADVIWDRGDEAFVDNKYSRRHLLRFDGGVEVPASSSTHVVPLPYSDPTAVDPEEMFVAALSSCHMLWFLSIAAKRKFRVERYVDHAVGEMTPNDRGKDYISRVTLRPAVTFSGESIPRDDEIASMHQKAHEDCFIANSVLATVHIEPVL